MCPGDKNPLPLYHCHNEVEINFLLRGRVVYNFVSHTITLPVRSLAVFWGGAAHRIDAREEGSEFFALHIPLDAFLGMGLPNDTFVQPILQGGFRHEPDPALAIHDEAAMRRWHDDLHAASSSPADTVRRAALCLELQARLLRLALANDGIVPSNVNSCAEIPGFNRMLLYITEHCRDPGLTVARIASHAGLSENHANANFRKACGVSLMRYVNQLRVTHAQRLLATSDAKVVDIAMDTGFGSTSQFHQVFRAVTGATPRGYAKARGNKG